MSTMDRFIQTNREVWDEWTKQGSTPAFDKLERFFRGEEILQPYELEELGDVNGKTLLHLQCHFGLDTVAWARRGARCTGVDLSPRSIEVAERLSRDVKLSDRTRFICSDIYGLPDVLDDAFDIVYTSLGVLAWLPDLDRWAGVIDRFLKPGGTFYVAEYHPFPLVFDDEAGVVHPRIVNRYFPRADPQVFKDEEIDDDLAIYGWPYSLGVVVTALATIGLRIEFLHEFPYSESQHIRFLEPKGKGTWGLPEEVEGELPLLFSIRATKPAP